jgi:hypothetical protein
MMMAAAPVAARAFGAAAGRRMLKGSIVAMVRSFMT